MIVQTLVQLNEEELCEAVKDYLVDKGTITSGQEPGLTASIGPVSFEITDED